MDVYVAGKTHDYMRVREVQRAVKRLGHYITYDWTRDVERHGPDNEISVPTNEDMIYYAMLDLKGVREAEALIVLGHPRLCGALIEMGIAVALGIPIHMVEVEQYSVFWHLPEFHHWPVYKQFMTQLALGNVLGGEFVNRY